MDKNKEFEILVKNLLFAFRQFCPNEILHEKVGGKFYTNFRSTWNTILLSLENDYLLGLAKVFDKPREFEKTITIYYFLDHKFTAHEEVITKIRNLRNKLFAHLDVKKMRKKDDFLKENQLSRSEIGALFRTTIDVLDQLSGPSLRNCLKSFELF